MRDRVLAHHDGGAHDLTKLRPEGGPVEEQKALEAWIPSTAGPVWESGGELMGDSSSWGLETQGVSVLVEWIYTP